MKGATKEIIRCNNFPPTLQKNVLGNFVLILFFSSSFFFNWLEYENRFFFKSKDTSHFFLYNFLHYPYLIFGCFPYLMHICLLCLVSRWGPTMDLYCISRVSDLIRYACLHIKVVENYISKNQPLLPA